MEQANKTTIAYFVVKGISDVPELQLPLFLLVLFLYFAILGGNMIILLLICMDHHLHTPMYFFLANLSIIDISSATVSLSKALVTFISGDKRVPYAVCVLQMYLYTSYLCVELLVLTAMGYDRYAAICKPLHYRTVMTNKVCFSLAGACWTLGFIYIIPNFAKILLSTCYISPEINHFFCDLVPLLKLSCSDLHTLQVYVMFGGAFLVCFPPCFLTLISYVFIIRTILGIRSRTGRQKAFYTCSSHLTVITLLYSTVAYQYFRPVDSIALGTNKLFSLFYTTAVPLLNPVIYSLKNQDVKAALRRTFKANLSKIKHLSK